MRHLRNMILVLGLFIFAIDSAHAKSLTQQEECAIEQVEAAIAYVQCLGQARITGIWEHHSDGEISLLSRECEAIIIEEAEAHSLAFGRQCDPTVDAPGSLDRRPLANSQNSTMAVKPKIPKHNFEWKGTFIGNASKLSDPQMKANLTIRGKWVGKYFNVYMEQGHKGSGLWVENILYKNKLYTITHEWHTDLPPLLKGTCFEDTLYNADHPLRPLPITVDDLNGILDSSRLVGLEIIDGKPMNHFRTTCLSKTGIPDFPWVAPFLTVNIFSDIYVPPGRAYPWRKWLQFVDGVGPDPQHDEWFVFDRWNHHPDDIILPRECRRSKSIKVQQAPCSNLVEQQ